MADQGCEGHGLPACGHHVVAWIRGEAPGPLLLAVAGVHGNEPAGVYAYRSIVAELERLRPAIRGDVVLLAGNTRALAHGLRYVDADLNRHWLPERVRRRSGVPALQASSSEDLELLELLEAVDSALAAARGDGFFVDLHTTSAPGKPFATIGDTLRNRRFASAFPVPKVLGLEEIIDGSLLEYLNGLGLVTMGFEGGQHEEEASVAHHEAALRIALVAAGCVDEQAMPGVEDARRLLERASGGHRYIEVRSRHGVRPGDDFEMAPGFENFQPIRRGQHLARDWRGDVVAGESGLLLLPRYQGLGDDGFFVGREVRGFWLSLSAALRRARLDAALDLLPGVRRQSEDPNTLLVNTRLARFFPLQLFHLLGYRKRRWSDDFLVVSRRRFDGAPAAPGGSSGGAPVLRR